MNCDVRVAVHVVGILNSLRRGGGGGGGGQVNVTIF